jgi:hypothetical protein
MMVFLHKKKKKNKKRKEEKKKKRFWCEMRDSCLFIGAFYQWIIKY